jgi:hypothetical protein
MVSRLLWYGQREPRRKETLMSEEIPTTNRDHNSWEQSKPQTSRGWAYLIAGLIAIVLILGGLFLYLPVWLAGF